MTPKEKFQKEEFQHLHETSPDEIGGRIKEKISQAGLVNWQIQEILGLIKKEKISELVGRLSEIIDLTENEKEHFKKVPKQVILKWFGIKEEQKLEEKNEEEL